MSEGSIGVRRGGQIRAKNAYDDLFAPFKERPYPPILTTSEPVAVESPTVHNALQRIKNAGLYVVPEHNPMTNRETNNIEGYYQLNESAKDIKQMPYNIVREIIDYGINPRKVTACKKGETELKQYSNGDWGRTGIRVCNPSDLQSVDEKPRIESFHLIESPHLIEGNGNTSKPGDLGPIAHNELQNIKNAGLYVSPEHDSVPNMETNNNIEGYDWHAGSKERSPWYVKDEEGFIRIIDKRIEENPDFMSVDIRKGL